MTTDRTVAVLGVLTGVSVLLNGALAFKLLGDEPAKALPPPSQGVAQGTTAGPDKAKEPEPRKAMPQASNVMLSIARLLAGAAQAKSGLPGDKPLTVEETLCRVARNALKDDWLGKRQEIVQGVRKDLADPVEQERNVRANTIKFARILKLEGKDMARLEQRYRGIRLARVQQIRAAIEDEPVNLEAMLDETRGLFTDEDRLIAELFGKDAAATLNAAEREGRVIVLIIIGTLAGIPWEEAVDAASR
ncbi:MAG: hypothetical protein PHU25_17275 [Deltaproteobacteria bacterium]|nr:hypothetical protein [Deltaproteobacteria bacterium]